GVRQYVAHAVGPISDLSTGGGETRHPRQLPGPIHPPYVASIGMRIAPSAASHAHRILHPHSLLEIVLRLGHVDLTDFLAVRNDSRASRQDRVPIRLSPGGVGVLVSVLDFDRRWRGRTRREVAIVVSCCLD